MYCSSARWGEKGDLGCLCLSVLHVLCILSFVMISAGTEGGMLASRVQERGGLRGCRVQSNFGDLGLFSVISVSLTCGQKRGNKPLFYPSVITELAAAASSRIK